MPEQHWNQQGLPGKNGYISHIFYLLNCLPPRIFCTSAFFTSWDPHTARPEIGPVTVMVPICQSQRSGDAKRICEIFTQKSRIPSMTKRETFMLLGLTRFIARFQSKKMCHATFWRNFHKFSIFWAASCRDPGHRYWNRTGRYKRPRHCTSINDTSVCVDPTAPMVTPEVKPESILSRWKSDDLSPTSSQIQKKCQVWGKMPWDMLYM